MARQYAHTGAHHSSCSGVGSYGVLVVIALIGIINRLHNVYGQYRTLPEKFTATFPALHRHVYNKWYIDELYDFLFVNPCKSFGNLLWKGFDVVMVDGIVNGTAKLVMAFSAGA